MQQLLLPVFAILTITLIGACNLEGDCYYQQEIPVTSFAVPDSVPEDSLFTINYDAYLSNSCGSYYTTNLSELEDTIYFQVWADFNGCDCASTKKSEAKSIELSLLKSKDYYFKAWFYNDSTANYVIITKKVKVYGN